MNTVSRNGKDLVERKEANHRKTIADLVSFTLYDRKIQVRIEDVAELNPHLIAMKTENGEFTELKEKIRDGLHAVVVKNGDRYEAFYCGIEPQTKQEADLFFRFIDYDIRTYRAIIERGTGKELNTEEWDSLKEGEHHPYILSNLPLLPVITIHLNFSDRVYKGRISIDHPYQDEWRVDDYALRLRNVCFDVFRLTDEELAWFGKFGILLGIIRYQNDLEGLENYMLKYYRIKKMSSDMIALT